MDIGNGFPPFHTMKNKRLLMHTVSYVQKVIYFL